LSPLFRSFARRIAVVVLAWAAVPAFAGRAAVDAVAPPTQPLGEYMTVLDENPAAPLSLADVLQLTATDRFVPAGGKVLGLGIGHRPIWVHLHVDNATDRSVTRYLAIGTPWIDDLDVHVVNAGQGTASWRTGDAVRGALHLNEALGYVFEYSFPPGRSEVLIRAATDDPLVLEARLLTAESAARSAARDRYAYGFFYGFLGALIVYNLVMFLTVGRRNSLFYSIYLITVAALNITYTGRSLAWLWPDAPGIQRYAILVLMVLTATTGLRFAREFLELDQRAPRLGWTLRWACRGALLLMAATVVAGWQEGAAWLAFVVVAVFASTMIGLGVFAVRHRQNAAGYFLVAAIASMIGVGLTLFAVWGLIPFNTWTYHGVEVGMMLDATLLSLALAKFVRMQMLERQRAERDARLDPLTLIFNRRGFYEQAEAPWRLAIRHRRPLSLVMMDLDHFKSVNDRFGHSVGDLVLAETGAMLARSIRAGDIVARWGGEEFILLLPETDLDAGAEFAERIRVATGALVATLRDTGLQVTASFGVGQLAAGQDLDALIDLVDKALYAAKQAGRDRVVRTDEVAPDGGVSLQESNQPA
jgi:diguanylate cyclase (GGDEF)-like protein